MKKLYWAAGIIVIIIVGTLDYYYEDYSRFMSAREMSNARYLKSELGSTRYQIYGENNQKTIILIPASNGYVEQWDPNVAPLVNAGYKVVVYDLFGRGLSSRPDVDLTLSVFTEQLDSVIREVEADRVFLIGSSFGGIIAAEYARNKQEKVTKLVFVGPAGWPSKVNYAQKIINIPVVGELLFKYFGEIILKPRVEGYFYQEKEHRWAIDMWQKFSQYPGFMRTYLSTLRHSPVLDYTEGWKALGDTTIKTLFIWGKQDISFDFGNSEKAMTLIPSTKVVAIDNAAHWLNIEQPKQVNNAMISFLNDEPRKVSEGSEL
ncbi:alpha/beta fold hydrolase [Pseudoalteromonas sp. MMG012]|uniref:alpha/beta fold hydrolase n=1 Tax=Pseudoalteromonas sp. MMG012 TaxID=2822686 RepID=UPI001B3A3483|nr:alpha/beta hydrolase [Pseudoalteromonas sp. MMG012]MBQ4852401.1 alpha/beta hydrolase [Pseudoalteromonas sp. MMG012]